MPLLQEVGVRGFEVHGRDRVVVGAAPHEAIVHEAGQGLVHRKVDAHVELVLQEPLTRLVEPLLRSGSLSVSASGQVLVVQCW